MSTLLEYPPVAVGIAEIGEASVVCPSRIKSRREAATPAAASGVLVSNLADTDAPIHLASQMG
jgi:hypothetical protein